MSKLWYFRIGSNTFIIHTHSVQCPNQIGKKGHIKANHETGIPIIFLLGRMTSPLATNFVSTLQSQIHYLQVDKNGYPLQGQIPQTVETYSGVGGVDYIPDGKDYLVVSGLGTGVLNIDLTADQDYNNMIGRTVTVYVMPSAGNNVTVDITGGPVARAFRLTGDTGDIATIAPGGWARLAFVDTVNCLIVGSALCTTA